MHIKDLEAQEAQKEVDLAAQQRLKISEERLVGNLVEEIQKSVADCEALDGAIAEGKKRLEELQLQKQEHEQLLDAQNIIQRHWSGFEVDGSPISLEPIGIPTALSVGKSHHLVSRCPKCSLGYHCNNWVPAPCGHTYHPHCLLSCLEISPSCLACKEVFHPDWLTCWGYKTPNAEVEHMERFLNLSHQRTRMRDQLLSLYSVDSMVAAKDLSVKLRNEAAPIPATKVPILLIVVLHSSAE